MKRPLNSICSHQASRSSDQQLIDAASTNNPRLIRSLLKQGVDINASSGPYGSTALHMAASEGHIEIVKLLLSQKKIDINAVNDIGVTALHYATNQKDTKIVELLLEQKANIEMVHSHNQYTPLHCAAAARNIKMVKLLLNQGANTEARSKAHSITALHYAVQNGHIEMVELLLRQGADIEAVDRNQCTPLHYATGNGYTKIVELLIRNKAAVNATDDKGATILHYATNQVEAKIVKLLLRQGANIEVLDKNQCTLLHHATENGYNKIAELLIAGGVNINAASVQGLTALHLAAHKGDAKMVKLLIQKGGKIDANDIGGCTALHLAAIKGHLKIVELLLVEGEATVNAANKRGLTALHIAAHTGSAEMINLLLEHGAEISDFKMIRHLDLGSDCDKLITVAKMAASICQSDKNHEQLSKQELLLLEQHEYEELFCKYIINYYIDHGLDSIEPLRNELTNLPDEQLQQRILKDVKRLQDQGREDLIILERWLNFLEEGIASALLFISSPSEAKEDSFHQDYSQLRPLGSYLVRQSLSKTHVSNMSNLVYQVVQEQEVHSVIKRLNYCILPNELKVVIKEGLKQYKEYHDNINAPCYMTERENNLRQETQIENVILSTPRKQVQETQEFVLPIERLVCEESNTALLGVDELCIISP